MSLEDPDVGRHADVFVLFFALCVMLAIRLPCVVNFPLHATDLWPPNHAS